MGRYRGWPRCAAIAPFPEAFKHAILTRRNEMTEAERRLPESNIDNEGAWSVRFMWERDTLLGAYDNVWWSWRYNPVRWHYWWKTTGHTEFN